ncbi:MAG TPA: SGNH/GDSL hydrolase family protein [Roseiarcus sp.]|nr:SGNH/GDSL hydrolase family protein [Roseiarcus sp.]
MNSRTSLIRSFVCGGLAAALAGGVAALAGTAFAADDAAWIATWAASPQPVWDADFLRPIRVPRSVRDQTVRQVGRVSIGGNRVRIVVSNEYGKLPLTIGAAHVALAGTGSAIAAGSDRKLTFSGQDSITIPPGAPAVSDPVDLQVPALGTVAVSLFFPEISPTTTWHNNAKQTGYLADGDKTGAADLPDAEKLPSRVFLTEIQVDAPQSARAVVTFGDSITDGEGSTVDANHRWPDRLAERLVKAGANVAIVNEGISVARVLRDRMGDNALARFDRDVLSQPRADTVVLMMGINDVGWPDTIFVPKGEPAPSAQDVIAGYDQLIARAHEHHMRILGATLTPFEDTFHGTPLYGYYDEAKEAKREAINDWIRKSGQFDGVIDFDALTRDPADPKHIKAEYDHGDHLHPNDAGYEAMAASIDLGMLGVK